MTDTLTMVNIRQIVADPRCQSRTGIEPALVHEYAESIREGANLPPLSAIDTGSGYYLYDGFHRLEAYRLAGKKQVPVEAEPGDLWDAVERSCAVNGTHGKRRTSADKHRAVETMIKVMVHRGEAWSDREIARRCAVSHAFVSNIRPSVSVNGLQMDGPRLATRNGTTYEINTSNIGKQPKDFDAPSFIHVVTEDTEPRRPTMVTVTTQEPPPFEEVDPSDPATFLEPWQPTPAVVFDEEEQREPSSPEERQAVVDALEVLFAALEREDGEPVGIAEVIEHIASTMDDATQVSLFSKLQHFSGSLVIAGYAIRAAKQKAATAL